jgi:hypothetical protein
MQFRHALPAAVAALVMACALPTVAQAPPKARFSDVLSYVGAPNLPLTIAVVTAGGGPKDFNSTKLVGVLAGAQTAAEVDKLSKQYGADTVKSFLTVFTFTIDDALAIAGDKKVALTAAPDPSPSDGKGLSAALYKSGLSKDGTYDVEYMLDALVSHPIHVQVMDDIDAKYGRKADANYHIVLTQAMTDLKAAYGL